MKKLLVMVLAVIMVCMLVSCNAAAGTQGSDPHVVSLAPSATQPTAEPTPEPTPANMMITADNEFSFSADDVFNTMKTDNEFATFTTRHTFEYDNYIADWASVGSIRATCFVSKTSNKVMAIVLACQDSSTNSSHGGVFLEYAKQILGMCNLDEEPQAVLNELSVYHFTKYTTDEKISNKVSTRFSWDDDFACFKIAPESTALDIASLPIVIDKPSDFFTDQTRKDNFNKMLESYDFNGIIETANDYINANNPLPEDNAYKAIELSQRAIDLLKKCKINKDKHTGDISIYYKGVEAISKSINFMPYLDNGDLTVRLGFKASDWVFFEDTSIKIGEDAFIENSYNYFDITHDVISGGILEYIDTTFSSDDIEKIINADSPNIRFEGKDDKKRDHSLTANEVGALKTLSELEDTIGSLSGMIYEWENL